ncbi:hypothetical protein MRX96_010642 [Rhipicephalus microplus]
MPATPEVHHPDYQAAVNSSLDIEPRRADEETAEEAKVPECVRRHVQVRTIPKNVNPVERRTERARALIDLHARENGAVYVDAAEYKDRRGAFTAAVVSAVTGDTKAAASVRARAAYRADEVAIALALADPGCTTGLSDSRTAVRNYARGRNILGLSSKQSKKSERWPLANAVLKEPRITESEVARIRSACNCVTWTPRAAAVAEAEATVWPFRACRFCADVTRPHSLLAQRANFMAGPMCFALRDSLVARDPLGRPNPLITHGRTTPLFRRLSASPCLLTAAQSKPRRKIDPKAASKHYPLNQRP